MPKNEKVQPWFSVKNMMQGGKKTVEAYIYGEITPYKWFENDVEAKSFIDELVSQEPFDNLDLHINSPGGDVFQAMAIYTTLKAKNYNITAYNDGIIASAATLPFLAAKTRKPSQGSMLVIHNPWSTVSGDSNAMEKSADNLKKATTSMVNIYKLETGLEETELRQMMDAETWMNADETIKKGFADELMDFEVAACISDNEIIVNDKRFDIKNFKNCPTLPKAIQDIKPPKNKEDENMDLEKLKAEHPEIYNSIIEEGKKLGTAETTAREASFVEISNGIDPTFLAECKNSGMTAEATAFKAMKEGKAVKVVENALGANFIANAIADNITAQGVETATDGTATVDEDTKALGAIKNFLKGGKK